MLRDVVAGCVLAGLVLGAGGTARAEEKGGHVFTYRNPLPFSYEFVGVADRVTGPYRSISPIPNGPCDTSLFADTDGRVYAVWPKYNVAVREIDLSHLDEGVVRFVGEEKLAVQCKSDDIPFRVSPEYLEGPWMERVGGKYILFYAANFRDARAPGYWVGAAYADSPLGPFRKDPRGQVFEGGHISVFDGPDGRKWFCYREEMYPAVRGTLCVDPFDLDANGSVQPVGPTLGSQRAGPLRTAESALAFSGPGVAFDLQGFIDAALARGAKRITVPPGRYRVTPRNREHLALRNLSDAMIDATGVEMICTETTRALTIQNCTNVTLRGLSVDYDPLPYTQGRITALSPDKTDHEIELFEGYPAARTVRNFKYEIFRPDTRILRCEDHGIKSIEVLDARRIRVTTTGGSATDPEQVGDIIAIGSEHAPGGSIPHAVECAGSRNVRLENIDLWASNCFGFLEHNCDGTTYLRCRIDRRPPESDLVRRADPRIRSLDADAFHSKHAVKGPAYLECTARFQGDDCVNICGDYHLVAASSGRALRVLSKQGKSINIAAGDTVELLSYTGMRLPDARVVAIEPDAPVNDAEKAFLPKQGMNAGTKEALARTGTFRITLDREVDLPIGSAICSTHRTGNGFVVRGCDFGYNRSRGILIKASDGVVEDNRLTGSWMHAILVSPEWWWLESGSSNNVRIVGNEIRDCRDVAINVCAFGGAPGVAPAGAHNNITVSGNRITGSPPPGILVTSTRGLTIDDNTFSSHGETPAREWVLRRFGLLGKPLEPLMTVNCEDVWMGRR